MDISIQLFDSCWNVRLEVDNTQRSWRKQKEQRKLWRENGVENRHLEQNQFIKSSSDQSAHFTFKENAGRYSERCTTIAGVLILNPLNPNISMQILHTVPYMSQGADKENVFNKQ